jgi:hypothetical protein
MGLPRPINGSSEPQLILDTVAFKRLGALLPLDGMLVHRRLPPQLLLVPICTPGLREASRVKCLVQETEYLAKIQTRNLPLLWHYATTSHLSTETDLNRLKRFYFKYQSCEDFFIGILDHTL